MYRCILIALTAGVILLAFAALPPMLPGSTTLSLFGSAQAQKTTPTTDATNLNSSRSNVNRMGGGGGTAKNSARTNQPSQINPKGYDCWHQYGQNPDGSPRFTLRHQAGPC